MNKLDPKFTQALQDWLNTPAEMRDLKSGCEMLFQASHNRALYNTVSRRPERYMAKLEYELHKYLVIRLDGQTRADVARMEKQVMKETPAFLKEAEITRERGKRSDHDQLPSEVQSLWDANLVLTHKINLCFNELKTMTYSKEPCDLYAKLKAMSMLEKQCREQYAMYDAAKPE